MNDGNDHANWTIRRCGSSGVGGRGTWTATLNAVRPDGDVAAVADIIDTTPGSVELCVQLVAERPPPAVMGELAREAARVAAESRARRLVVRLTDYDGVARDLVDNSGLDWQVMTDDEAAYAELALGTSGTPGGGPVQARPSSS